MFEPNRLAAACLAAAYAEVVPRRRRTIQRTPPARRLPRSPVLPAAPRAASGARP